MIGPMGTVLAVAGIVLSLVFGGVSLLGLSPPEFLVARGCFIVAAILLVVVIVMWVRKSMLPSRARFAITSGTILLTATALVSVWIWINVREAAAQALPTGSSVTITGGDNVFSVGQIGGITARTVTINRPLAPELRILGREDVDAPDGTHTAVIRTEVVSPISPGLLVIHVKAQAIKNVSVFPPPTGGVSTMMMRNVRRAPSSFSAEIPGPHGQYIITVVTEHPSDIQLDASF